jgi:mRNA interferase HigB
VVFNIHGNDFRLIADIYFPKEVLFVKFLGTHAEYDRVDAETVNDF